jgi:hypothetical protein
MLNRVQVCLLAIAMLTAGLTLATSETAVAALHCGPGQTPFQPPPPPRTPPICIPIGLPGGGGGSGSGGGAGSGGGGQSRCFTQAHVEVPCSYNGWPWWASRWCYAHQVSLPKSDPAWQGHRDGSLWTCPPVHIQGLVLGDGLIWWVPPGQQPAPRLPDPARLAQHALGLLYLSRADVQTAPAARIEDFVNLKTWLWVPAGQWRPLTKSVAIEGTRVTVTAKPVRTVWNMGDGGSTTCSGGPGRAWVHGMGESESTSCGYTYTKPSYAAPNARWPVTARIFYEVKWVCTGACLVNRGTLGEVAGPTGRSSLHVGERESVVVR